MRSGFIAASLFALIVALFATTFAHAAPAPLVIERLARVESPDPARLVAGGYDAAFESQPYAAIVPSREHDVWYRIRLTTDWDDPRPPVLAIFDPVGCAPTFTRRRNTRQRRAASTAKKATRASRVTRSSWSCRQRCAPTRRSMCASSPSARYRAASKCATCPSIASAISSARASTCCSLRSSSRRCS